MEPLDALDYLLRVRKACLLPLDDITISADATLDTLKTVLLTHPGLAAARWRAVHGSDTGAADPALVPEGVSLGPGITTKHLRVREMGLNSVPGR